MRPALENRAAIGLKVELQSLGVRVRGLPGNRAGGAGPADGITVFIDDLVATVPTGAPYVGRSPYSMSESDRGSMVLEKDGIPVGRARVAEEPSFYDLETESGVPYRKLALRHGRDGVGSTVTQTCDHGAEGCRFCAISVSSHAGSTLPKKAPDDLALVAAAAREEGYSHFVLTTGTTGEDAGIVHLADCSRAVKSRSGMNVHVQFEPPRDAGLIDLAASVADSAAINIECFDAQVLGRVAPGKARTGLDDYRRAWARAVEVFGPGQVTSFVIIGLGESPGSVMDGVKLLASMGVYPFLLPLRPLRGTALESWSPPEPGAIIEMFEGAAKVVQEAGLSAGACLAGCVRCGACTAFADITG
jgi:radical SAM protein (TIGR04043 family)